MEKKKAISQYRERLDNTLSSAELTDPETLKTLVKNQILRYAQHEKEEFSEHLLDKRAQEVSNFLDMLRSTSVDDHQVSESSETSHGEWKVCSSWNEPCYVLHHDYCSPRYIANLYLQLKHDNEEFRVMYREGPHGTPFHTLLVEGYVDGPLDVCLCISWESPLYKKWWPQSSFPPFKVTSSTCLQKIRIGEQIALVRVKVAWPLSAREALVHYFFFEYFQDDLIVILVNTISDVSDIDKATHGFTNDGIPEAKDVVRIDVVGGFALQKVNNERSYFRTIANMDMKLDFVPPSLINFIARQLIGNGFRLYQKTVASVTNSDEDYSKALGDPLFCLIRGALFSNNKSGEVLEAQEIKREPDILPKENEIVPKENEIVDIQDGTHDAEPEVHANEPAGESPPKIAQDAKRKAFGEIEEEESEESTCLEESIKAANQPSTNSFADSSGVNAKQRVSIRPEVEEALGTLEKAISIVRQYRFNAQSSSSFSDEETPNFEEGAVEDSTFSAEANVCSKVEVGHEAGSKKFAEDLEMTSDNSKNSNDINNTRSGGSNSMSREVHHNKVVPASPHQNASMLPMDGNQVGLNSYGNGTIKTNGFHEKGVEKPSKWRKHRYCCFGFNSG
ncbi:START-2 domain protein [Gossypium australe]|uniref:START-2 domain protein n=1 Tax=Gossypium australe TaxID=47621 RepID=A0A5B6UF89_9ROSI|nr:START-2 domain protein [Gossypium australe]